MTYSLVSWEKQYATLVLRVLSMPNRPVRNGVSRADFVNVIHIDTEAEGFPILRGRKMHYLGVLGELAAMLKQPTNIKDFKDEGCNYWDKWGDADGNLKLDYGHTWRNFNGVDQLANVVETLNKDPTDRRMIVSAWRPETIPSLSLPCCHMLYHWYVREDKYLDLMWYQRSADLMLGVPSDIVLAAALNALVANQTRFAPGRIAMVFGDTHIYKEHFIGAKKYLEQHQALLSMDTDKYYAKNIFYQLRAEATIDNFKASDYHVGNFISGQPIQFELKE